MTAVYAPGENQRESRMREIRTSDSTRERAPATAGPSLLYGLCVSKKTADSASELWSRRAY